MESKRPASGTITEALAHELHDLTRALGGALLFGVPLLLTMEMWWLGAQLPRWQAAALVGVALVCCYALVRPIGFKRETTFSSRLDQAVHAVAAGAVASFVMLLVLNRLSLADGAAGIAGAVAVQALPLSLGASVANAVLKRGEDRHTGQEEGPWRSLLHKCAATLAGGAFIAFSAAPTEEVVQLAAGLTYGHQLALLAVSLAAAHVIVFQSGYHPEQEQGGRERVRPRGQRMVAHAAETAATYVVALALALAAVLVYNRGAPHAPLHVLLPQVLVLGLPATLGGAAGRLVL